MFIQGEYPAGLELLKMVKYIFFLMKRKSKGRKQKMIFKKKKKKDGIDS